MSNITELAVRKCRICNEVKPLFDFHKDPNSSLGRRTECKPCRSVERSKYDYIKGRFLKHQLRNGGNNHYTDDLILRLRTATHCQFCGDEFENVHGSKRQATLDHLYAQSGVNVDGNIAVICRSDNSSKGTMHIYDYYQSSERFTDELWSAFLKDWIGRLYNREVTDADIPFLTECLRDESIEFKVVNA